MKYLSICSGIEAATVAWKPLGWQAVGFSEIEPFPCSLLQHYYPEVKNYGDMNDYEKWDIEPGTVDPICGGTPCQDFSVAGLRAGMDGERGNLTLTFLRLVDYYKPRWLVWENVPGVFSTHGNPFGQFLQGLRQCGYGVAYRIIDAQYFRVPQRRRRVFVVGYFGDWRCAAAVLFERESLCRDITPRREKGKRVAGTVKGGAGKRGWSDPSDGNGDGMTKTSGTFAARPNIARNNIEGLIPDTAQTISKRMHKGLSCGRDGMTETAIVERRAQQVQWSSGGGEVLNDITNSIRANRGSGFRSDGTPVESCVINQMRVRRFTPREVERLFGYEDDYTLVPHNGKPASDSARYKALGNSMAVPCMTWLGKRIQMMEDIAVDLCEK